MRNYFGNDPEFHFQFPLDGDCLNCYDGQETPEGLLITVRVNGRAGSSVAVNEQPAEWNGTCYTCGILLRHYRTTLEAADLNSGEKTSIAVYKLHDPVGKYRLSSDDNILFLQDINDHKDTYQSIFDNPYLAVYKKAGFERIRLVHLWENDYWYFRKIRTQTISASAEEA